MDMGGVVQSMSTGARQKTKEGIACPGAGITGGLEVLGTKLGSSASAVSALPCGAIFPAPAAAHSWWQNLHVF